MKRIDPKIVSALKGKNAKKRIAAQSLVEFAITLPVIILLLTGMTEFGFMLNTYLSVQDAARSAARRFSVKDPFNNPTYYEDAAEYVIENLAPPGDPESRQIVMDPTRDNILISLIGVEVQENDPGPDTISEIIRYTGDSYYEHFDDTHPPTAYLDEDIEALMTANDAEPTDAGLLIIEVYYGYEGTLNLPWTEPFFSPSDPFMMYVSVIMPTIYVKPFDHN